MKLAELKKTSSARSLASAIAVSVLGGIPGMGSVVHSPGVTTRTRLATSVIVTMTSFVASPGRLAHGGAFAGLEYHMEFGSAG
jgi:hypothetical protein